MADRTIKEELIKMNAANITLFEIGEELDEMLDKLGYELQEDGGDYYLFERKTGDTYPMETCYFHRTQYVQLNHYIELEGSK